MSETELPQEGLGDRIARLRRTKGWNQKELAERLGVRSNQVSKFERGTYQPKPGILGPLAETLGTTVDFLLTGREARVQRDQRLRNLLPLLENLPEDLRDALVSALEGVVKVHNLIEGYQKRTKARQT